MARTTNNQPLDPSPLSTLLSSHAAKHSTQSLPLEILHNLQYQHSWTDLRMYAIINGKLLDTLTPLPTSAPFTNNSSPPLPRNGTSTSSESGSNNSDTSKPVYILSGLPPKHAYIHPDFQNQLLRHQPHPVPESDIVVQREYVIPLSLSQKLSLKQFAGIFDALPERTPMRKRRNVGDTVNGSINGNGAGRGAGVGDDGGLGINWKDAKRVILGMLSANGMGGDGTVVYYVMQEGEVKPRQNG